MRANKIYLLMAIHCHQPVGNFDSVMEDAYERAYLPFVEVLARHPKIRLSLHYTGPLLEFLERRHPDFLERLRGLVERRQIDLLGGGFYEPILALLPERDAIGQIEMMSSYLKHKFGIDASGMWLAERIWEPKLPAILGKANMNFTIVDDSHFAAVGRDVESLDGYYISEDEGIRVAIFPTSEKLRYYMPFKLPEETITYLRQKLDQGFTAITFGDDGEKFGLWPGTFKWVYEEGWLENFFTMVENCDWIVCEKFREFIKSFPPTGICYIPCLSYREMMEWSRGFFRNFFVKYPESNRMHKRMLLVSEELKNRDIRSAEKISLFKAQCNCGYWHGVFGGLYLNHLRSAIYSNLIAAENMIDASHREVLDYDCDGNEELILRTDNLCIILSNKGYILELDHRGKMVNVCNVISRRPEHYHQKLFKKADGNNENGAVVSIHDLNVSNVSDLSVLQYDKYLRDSFIDYLVAEPTLDMIYSHNHLFAGLGTTTSFEAFDTGCRVSKIFLADNIEVTVEKKIKLVGNKVSCNLFWSGFSTEIDKDLWLSLEVNYSLFDPNWSNRKGVIENQKELWFNDEWYGITIIHRSNIDARVVYYPVHTISDSEHGVETTYQGTCFVWMWLLDKPEGNVEFEIEMG